MNRDFLKEAIADAKTIKETAIVNAKKALEETFTPHLQSMLSAKISEMEESDLEENDLEEVETTNEMDETMDEMMKKEMEDENLTYETKMKKSKDLEEVDLDELLAELEEVNEAEEEMDDTEMDSEMDDMDVDSETSEEEFNLEDMSEEELVSFIENVIEDMIKSGELEAGESMESEEELDEEINLESLFNEEEEMEEAYEEEEGKMMETLKNKLKMTKTELEEAYSAINEMKNQLNEVNLLNAKLLYVNKIFKSKTLSENQKLDVLTAFDKATNVKEVKLIFETLHTNFKTSKTPIKENRIGSASKPTQVVSNQKPIMEVDTLVTKFQKLAGII
jgi:hypothetical protein